MRTFSTYAAIIWLGFSSAAFAQDAVPGEILTRTKLIRVGNGGGTAFAVDYQGKMYLVTAKHVVAELPNDKPTLQIWHSSNWENVQFVRTLFPTSSDVDIAVLETDSAVPASFSVLNEADEGEGPTLGQQVWFLGYPFGDISMTSRFQSEQIPFIKRGTLSAINGSDPNAVVIYVDGFNNPGFSGGPIVYWDFRKRAYRIMGVVKGYRTDRAKVEVNGQQLDSNVLINSGILIGYSIKHAVEAIKNGQK